METCSMDDVFFEYPLANSECTHKIGYSNDKSIVDTCKAFTTDEANCKGDSNCDFIIPVITMPASSLANCNGATLITTESSTASVEACNTHCVDHGTSCTWATFDDSTKTCTLYSGNCIDISL